MQNAKTTSLKQTLVASLGPITFDSNKKGQLGAPLLLRQLSKGSQDLKRFKDECKSAESGSGSLRLSSGDADDDNHSKRNLDGCNDHHQGSESSSSHREDGRGLVKQTSLKLHNDDLIIPSSSNNPLAASAFNKKNHPMSESPATSALTTAFGSQPKKSSFERQQRRSTAIARKITSDENPSKRVDQRNRLFSSDVIEFQQLKIEEAKRHKRAAQELYNRGDFFDSLTHLHKAVKNFKVQQLDEQLLRENEAVYRIIRECYLFSASCYIKINQFEQAVNILTQIIDVEPSNIKALYLRGKAGLLLGEVLQAYHDFQTALEVDPQNTLIKNYLSSLVNQYPDIEQQSGQMKRLNSQQFNSAQSPQQLTREVGITDGPKAALPLKKRSHFQSMNSTNVNSGSESTIEADGESKNAFCPLTSTRFLKKDDSLMHPSSPSKIQIDSAPKYNNKPLIKRKTSSSANSNNSVATTEGAKKSHVPTFNDQFDVAVMLKKLWTTHKGSVYSVLKTIFVLVVLIMLKRALQRLIPPALLAKIKSFLL